MTEYHAGGLAPDFTPLFRPRAIAVVGASQNEGSVGGQPLRYLRERGYGGPVYAINPHHELVQGLHCYPDITRVPDPAPDVVLVALPARAVPDVLEQCASRGVRFAVLFSGGFAESGGAGAILQERIREIASRSPMRVIGPNCQGLLSVTDGVFAGFGSAFDSDFYRTGPVSMVTQSGGFGFGVMNLAQQAGIGFRHVVSTGNEVDVTALDILGEFVTDDETNVLAAYLEGVDDGRRLLEVGSAALVAGKPLLVWKVGTSNKGREAALSHTARMTGTYHHYHGAFRQVGAIELSEARDLIDYARGFSARLRPAGKRVGVLTISGGAGVVFADRCAELDLELPPLGADTMAELKRHAPAFASLENPVDITAQVFNDPDLIARSLIAIATDSGIDSIVLLNASLKGPQAEIIGEAVGRVATDLDKPVYVVWNTLRTAAERAFWELDKAAVPVFEDPVRCAEALSVVVTFERAHRLATALREEADVPKSIPGGAEAARALLEKYPQTLVEYQAKEVLRSLGLPVTREALAQNADEAVAIAESLGYPVALKIQSRRIMHKSDIGGVALNITSSEELVAAYDDITKRVRDSVPENDSDGVLVQEFIRGAIEAIVGVITDNQFGLVVMFGLGGVFTEVLDDFACRVAPFDMQIAHEMMRDLRGFEILQGARGREPADLDIVARLLSNLSHAAYELGPKLEALDINPLFIRGASVRVGDALLIHRVRVAADGLSAGRRSVDE